LPIRPVSWRQDQQQGYCNLKDYKSANRVWRGLQGNYIIATVTTMLKNRMDTGLAGFSLQQ
jgi:hypothetical protein